MLRVVCGLVSVRVVRCLLVVGCWLLKFGGRCFVRCCLMCVVRCLSFVGGFVVDCWLFSSCWPFVVGCLSLSVVCWVSFGVCCRLCLFVVCCV